MLLGADADPERGVAVAFAAIDNLVKGAAGQAVQNANLMLGSRRDDRPRRPARERAMNKTANDDYLRWQDFATPLGFRFGAVAAGVKQAGGARARTWRSSPRIAPCAAAGIVHRQPDARRAVRFRPAGLPAKDIRAIVANSGNANAIVGPAAPCDERTMAKAVAKALGSTRRRC